MHCYELPFGVTVKVDGDGSCGGVMSGSFKDGVCPCCGQPTCFFDCDESQTADSPESEDDAQRRYAFNTAMEGIESMILAHACAGIDVGSPAYMEGIETAMEAVENNV